ncbi:MAG: effector binding domain-containing protein [Bacteroidetes bacterium]|nr:effector binding domain-containing protein [Bacteroidota bacterium]
MEKIKINPLKLIGISVRTTNENGQSAKDIPFLWNKFFEENIPSQIHNKIGTDIYCMYTDYVKEHTQPYTAIIGLPVTDLDSIPKGLIGKVIDGGDYTSFSAKGKISEGIVFNEWLKIWASPIDRKYTSDFEVYDLQSLSSENAEVKIFIALK